MLVFLVWFSIVNEFKIYVKARLGKARWQWLFTSVKDYYGKSLGDSQHEDMNYYE